MKAAKGNQQDSWRFQSIITFVVYITSLIFVAVLVNYNQDFDYDPGIIFDNQDFNLFFGVVVAVGITSLVFSLMMDNSDRTL